MAIKYVYFKSNTSPNITHFFCVTFETQQKSISSKMPVHQAPSLVHTAINKRKSLRIYIVYDHSVSVSSCVPFFAVFEKKIVAHDMI